MPEPMQLARLQLELDHVGGLILINYLAAVGSVFWRGGLGKMGGASQYGGVPVPRLPEPRAFFFLRRGPPKSSGCVGNAASKCTYS